MNTNAFRHRALALLAFALPTAVHAQDPRCTEPGVVIATDADNDNVGGAAAHPSHDIRSLSVAEQHYTSGTSLVFTMKVDGLATFPDTSTRWIVFFKGANNTAYYVRMVKFADASAPIFEYGPGTDTAGGCFNAGRAPAAGSSHAADGTIRFVVPLSGIGAPAPGQTITEIQGVVQPLEGGSVLCTTGGAPSNLDTTSPLAPYTLAGAGVCPTVEPPPVEVACAATGAPSARTLLWPSVSRDFAQLSPTATYGAFVHFSMGTPEQHRTLLSAGGLVVRHDFEQYASSVYATGPLSGFMALVDHPSVSAIEENASLRYLGDTHGWATRARIAQEPVAGGPYRDASARILDGAGVGIAIVDSGVNAPHPDLIDRTSRNFKVSCLSPLACAFQDLGTTASSDTTGGHGTHCAGIALGDGTASDGFATADPNAPNTRGTFTGVAPGAKLYAFGAGEGLSILTANAAASFDWILKNNPALTTAASPRIRVVSNSYGGDPGLPYNAGGTLECLARALVESGVSVVFAASNDGGDGSADRTNSYCKDPTPGVICVANYDDLASGRIDGPLNASSSRGKKGEPDKYPDISAPGTNITATCNQAEPGQGVCATGAESRWQPHYGTISGTSMATPHVAGALALLYQARPGLTPAQAELLIQNTARKVRLNADYVADPQNPGGTIHFGYGAGLLNMPEALDALSVARGTVPAAGSSLVVFDADADPIIAGAADIVGLTMQEFADPAGPLVEYRITVRNATEFDTQPLVYRLAQNVNGRHFETAVTANAAGVTIPAAGAGNTAPATSATRTGNVVTMRVPYMSLGYPPLAAPIHNIAMSSFDLNGAVDFAPSPPVSFGVEADLSPMFGKSYTTGLAVPAPGSGESVCTLPGKIVMLDDPGDTVQAPPGSEAAYDIQLVRVAEPATGTHAGFVVVTLKVANFPGGTIPQGTRWVVRFNAPPKAPPAGEDDFLVMMTTESSATPRFVYGTTGVKPTPDAPAGARVFTIVGDLGNGSNVTPDGAITLVLAKDNPLFGPLVAGNTLTKAFPTVRAVATPANNAIFDQGEEFEYTLRAANACAVVANLPPVASLTAVPTSGVAPLPVAFNGGGSSDPDAGDTIASYTLDFGDGSTPVTQSGASFNHTYAQPGTYTASLRVTDSRGLQSTSAAQRVVTVTTAQGATPPGAPTIGAATPGDREASIAFTAPSSDGGSPITGYTATCSPGNASATGPASPLVVGALVNGTTYFCRVSATNSAGTGPASEPVQVTPRTVPGAPVIGAATPGNGQVSLAFGAPSSDGGSQVTGYTATCTPGGATGSSAAAPIVVSGLANGTTYSCTVRATNAAGTGPASAAVQVTPRTTPAAPQNVSVVVGDAEASVAFTAPSSDGGAAISSYTVTCNGGAVTATGSTSPIRIAPLQNGTAYTCTVHARNSAGAGAESASVVFTPQSAGAANDGIFSNGFEGP